MYNYRNLKKKKNVYFDKNSKLQANTFVVNMQIVILVLYRWYI